MTTPTPQAHEFIVRLVMRTEAPTDQPGLAVIDFVDQLTENGLRDWVFRVEDHETNEILGYFDGYGTPYVLPAGTDEGSLPGVGEGPTPLKYVPPQAGKDDAELEALEEDAELEALAESLNDSSPHQQE